MKSFGNTIWKKAAVLGLAACMALTACDNGKGGAESKNPAESIEESVSQSASEAVNAQSGESTESTPESSEPAQEALSADAKELFEAIQGWEFMFSSGAGGWDTSFQVDENGSFSGQFHDSDMGDTGEGYDNGTLYLSLFSGNFTGVKKISEYTYEATVTGLTYENTPGTEEIVDGVRRMYTEAYGLIGTDKVQIYLPGKKVSELSEEFIGWMMDLGGVYVFGQYYNDYPEELPFCGIYNPGTKEGFSSTNYSGKNLVYLRNKAAFPGLKNIRMDMNADGTYFCQDMNDLGTYVVTNLCYKQTNGQADTEAFINDVISHFVEGKSYADLYYLDYSFADSTPDMIYMNGNLTYMAGWTCGTNEDLRYYVARMTTIGDYVYAYGYSSSEYDELMHGEAGGLYLSSLTTTGDPAKISSAGEDKVARTIHAVVTFNGADVSNILADEVVFIGLGDEDLMAQYGLTYDDMPNDYAVVGNDGVYKEYRLSENCPIYVQYPAEGPFQKLCDKARFHNKLTDNTYVYLMELFLDENGIVTFMYEPYRP